MTATCDGDRRPSDPAGLHVAEHVFVAAEKDDAVTGRIRLIPFQLVVGDLDLSPDIDVRPATRLVGTIVGEERRIGIPWLGWTDGDCPYCRSDRENLCDNARFTGYHIDGGYADYALVSEDFAHPLPTPFADENAAP